MNKHTPEDHPSMDPSVDHPSVDHPWLTLKRRREPDDHSPVKTELDPLPERTWRPKTVAEHNAWVDAVSAERNKR